METTKSLKLQLKSLHPYKTALDMVDDVRTMLPDIASELGPTYGPLDLKLDQAETLPIDPETIKFVVHIAAGAVGSTILKRLANDIYDAIKKKIANISIKRLDEQS